MTKGGLAGEERASVVGGAGAIASWFLVLRPEAATDVRQRAELETSGEGHCWRPCSSPLVVEIRLPADDKRGASVG